jgi:ribosomal-protein-alanine N-acetyltransferase
MIVRQVTNLDRQIVANFVYFERYIHRHLDWKTPLDWVGKQPFLLLEEDRKIAAVLACPPDPPDVAWIRLFVSSAAYDLATTWKMLWQNTLESWEKTQEKPSIAAIPLSSWFRNLLESSNFQLTDRVVVLICPISDVPDNPIKANIQIRAMQVEDLEVVEKVDNAAFKKIWQNSLTSLMAGYKAAAVATVAHENHKVVGYQISTPTANGGHLARLAVMPDYQGRGIGSALVKNMLDFFATSRAQSVTVNTQASNLSSLELYQHAGFQRSGEDYSVYQYQPADE